MMKWLGQRYVQYVNRSYPRSGTLCEKRFRIFPRQEEDYLLGCYHYIELTPAPANMVEPPAEYPWTRYAANAQGEPTMVVTPHHLYSALGPGQDARQLRYRELFAFQLDPGLVDEIRTATNGNYALGGWPSRLKWLAPSHVGSHGVNQSALPSAEKCHLKTCSRVK